MSLRRGSVVLAIVPSLALACSDTVPRESSPTATGDAKSIVAPAAAATPVEAPITGDAVVRAGARLFFAPTGDAGFELPTQATARGMAVHVVGEESGRLVIETLSHDPPEHHCAATLAGLASFRLRFHVTKDDLLPVLADPIEHTFADGTKIRVGAGVAVPSGAEQVFARGTAVTIAVPPERIARSYRPGTPFSEQGGDGKLAALDGHALSYDGHILAEDALFAGGSATRFGVTERSEDALVTVRNPCLEATVKVSLDRLRKPVAGLYTMKGPAEAIPEIARNFDPDLRRRDAGILGALEAESEQFLASPYGGAVEVAQEDVWGGLTGTEIAEAFGAGGIGLMGTGTRHVVKAGAAIWWADGRAAGQVIGEHRFATAPRDEAGRKCFDARLVADGTATVALCFAPADVEPLAAGTGGTIGLGSVGLIGRGGTRSGFGGGTVPKVRQATAEIKGALDKDIIRRIVRAHINEIRYCYNQGLHKDPSLAGRVAIEFTIAADGSVAASDVATTTVADAAVGTCAAKAVKRWKFPKPEGGGTVVVKYPFVLEPG